MRSRKKAGSEVSWLAYISGGCITREIICSTKKAILKCKKTATHCSGHTFIFAKDHDLKSRSNRCIIHPYLCSCRADNNQELSPISSLPFGKCHPESSRTGENDDVVTTYGPHEHGFIDNHFPLAWKSNFLYCPEFCRTITFPHRSSCTFIKRKCYV